MARFEIDKSTSRSRMDPNGGHTGAVTRSMTVRPSPLFLGLIAATVFGGVLCVLGNEQLQFGIGRLVSTNEVVMVPLNRPVGVTAGVVLLVLGGWAVSLCLHEFGHAYLALRGGDYSVRAKGYLTLDPRRYTDPVFSLVLPLVFLIVGGIPLPGGAVWINHHALRDRRAESLVSLAGPIANLVLGLLLSVVLRFVPMPDALAVGLSYLALIQVVAFILNILPIPGLDGWGVIEPYLSYQAKEFGAKARPWAPLVLFVLLIGFHPVSNLLYQAADAIDGTIVGDSFTSFSSAGQSLFLFWR